MNGAEERVEVSSVSTSCGCAVVDGVATYRNKTVAPGDELTLSGELNTQKAPGSKRHVVTLTLASGARYSGVLTLTVHGTYELSPGVLEFGTVDLDAPPSAVPNKVIIFESTVDQLVGRPVAAVPWLECETVDGAPAKSTILVRLRADRLAPGLNTGTLCVQTTSDVKPAACVYVRVTAVRELTATPQDVFLVGSEVRRVRFTDRDNQLARVVSVEHGDGHIVVSVLDTGEIELSNPTGVKLREAVRLRVRDSLGRQGVVLVTAF